MTDAVNKISQHGVDFHVQAVIELHADDIVHVGFHDIGTLQI